MAKLEQIAQYYPNIETNYSVNGPSVYGDPDPVTIELLQTIPQGGLVIETGAGDGRYTLPMLEQGLDVIANDIDDEALTTLQAKAQKRQGRQVVIAKFNAFETFDIDTPKPVDAVVNTALLYLLPEQYIRDFTKAAHEVTKEKGLLIVDFVTNRKRIDKDGKEKIGKHEVQYDAYTGLQTIDNVMEGLYKVSRIKFSQVDQDLRETVGYRITGNKISVLAQKR